jgi:hypothetical protein
MMEQGHMELSKYILIGLLCILGLEVSANEVEPPKIGNFALPTSQQPGPFVSLGQNIIDAKVAQLYLLVDDFVGKNKQSIDVIPSVLYGIPDKSSIYFNIPVAASYHQDDTRSSGLEDMFLQFEYAYHVGNTSRFSEQATILANITFPTGSTEKEPTTGVGAVSFLLGTTYSRTYCDWYGFISPGAIMTTSHDQTKFGSKYLYQFGIGRNLSSKPSAWILSALLEIDGQYTDKDKIQDEINNNSGGNVIMITPSLWFSTSNFILQFGAGFPAVQDLFGEQNKNHYLLVTSLGWTL